MKFHLFLFFRGENMIKIMGFDNKIKVIGTIENLYKFKNKFEDVISSIYESIPKLPDYKDYVLEFCGRCKKYLKTKDSMCFKHKTLMEAMSLIGNESNHNYLYEIDEEIMKVYMKLGASIYMKPRESIWYMELEPEMLVITRPSGLKIRYEAHKNNKVNRYYVTSHLYFSKKFIEFVDFVLKHVNV